MTNLDTVVKTTTITVIYKNTKTQTSKRVLFFSLLFCSSRLSLLDVFQARRIAVDYVMNYSLEHIASSYVAISDAIHSAESRPWPNPTACEHRNIKR